MLYVIKHKQFKGNTTMTMENFTRGQVAEKTGLDPRLVQFYTDEGVVTPESGGGRRGQSWKYSRQSLLDFAVIKNLNGYGMTLKKVRQVINALRGYTLYKQLIKRAGGWIDKGGHRIMLYIYDQGETVTIVWNPLKKLKEQKGQLCYFSMIDKKSALILDITDEVKAVISS